MSSSVDGVFVRIVRFISEKGLRLGVVEGSDVIDLTALGQIQVTSFIELTKIAANNQVTLAELIYGAIKSNSDILERYR